MDQTKQIDRYNFFCNQEKKANKEHYQIKILTDDINTLDESNKTNYTKNIVIKKLFQGIIIENTMTIHNPIPTFFWNNTKLSCIDHIISNTPSKISNITTYNKANWTLVPTHSNGNSNTW